MISGYNLENLILEEVQLNKRKPLLVYYDHGWNLSDLQVKSFIQNPYTYHFTWNRRISKIHSSIKNKKFIITGSPFIYYAQKNGIKKKAIKNTIFFFSHTMPLIDQIIDLDKVISTLKNLPENLKPIDVCLHYYDRKLKNIFEKEGFNVITPGKVFSLDYHKKFFDILSQYSFSCSNTMGSYVLYSLFLDIPFHLVGPEPIYNNYGNDKNVPKIYKLSENKTAHDYSKLFKTFSKFVTKEQKKLSTLELGLEDRISPSEMRKIIQTSAKISLQNPLILKKYFNFYKRVTFAKFKSIVT